MRLSLELQNSRPNLHARFTIGFCREQFVAAHRPPERSCRSRVGRPTHFEPSESQNGIWKQEAYINKEKKRQQAQKDRKRACCTEEFRLLRTRTPRGNAVRRLRKAPTDELFNSPAALHHRPSNKGCVANFSKSRHRQVIQPAARLNTASLRLLVVTRDAF